MAKAHFADALSQVDAEDDRDATTASLLAAIRAEPYDPAAVQSAMAGYGEARAQRWAVLRERLATLLAQFTPAERDAFADRLQDRMEHWRERRGD